MKGDTMRPLIEILEDERTLMHKLDSLHRYMLKDDDVEVIDILTTKKFDVERKLGMVRIELREYMAELFK